MKYHLICLICLFLSVLIPNELLFNTPWGDCTLINNSHSLSSDKIIDIINLEIEKMSNDYSSIPKNDFIILIPHSESISLKHPHWKWSLGITYSNPDKIIIKDPALSKISWKKFKKVISHELNHIMLNRVQYRETIPRWFKEGVAMKVADEISIYHKLKIASKTNNRLLFNLSNYNHFHNMTKEEFHFAYAISSASIVLLEKIYGEDTIKIIVSNLIEGNNFEKSFFNATGVSIKDFNNIFYDRIKNNFFWFKLVNLPKNLFTIMPLLLIIGFYIKSYKNNKIIKKWELEEQLENLEDTDIN